VIGTEADLAQRGPMDTPQTPVPHPDASTPTVNSGTAAEQTVVRAESDEQAAADISSSETASEGSATSTTGGSSESAAAHDTQNGMEAETRTPMLAEAQEPVVDASEEAVNQPVAAETAGTDEAVSEGESDVDPDAKPFDPAVFDEALNRVLSSAGGEVLFRIAGDAEEAEKVAAVRLGDGEARLIALVILPPNGAPLRVEPVDDSANPLAPLARSYASLVDAWKAAA